jgi:hypothetical protein
MTETDIWIEVFKRLNYRFIDEQQNSFSTSKNSNILRYEGIVDSRPNKIRLLFCRKTEWVFSVYVEDIHNNWDYITYNKETFKEKYKSLFRDVTIHSLITEK